MEQWQAQHIRSNLSDLIHFTFCNPRFLAYLTPVFSKEDESIIDAKLKTDGCSAGAKLLYEIAITRAGSYDVLKNALLETNQTGALRILEHGIKTQVTSGALLYYDIDFQGIPMHLKDILQGLKQNALEELTEFYVNSKRTSKIVIKNSVPQQLKYYIPRRLTPRSHLDQSLFAKHSKDVFVIRGIQPHKLSLLAGNQGTDFSSSQREGLTTQFILLEYEEDFERICKFSACQPIHLLDHNAGQFHWVKTHGNVSSLQKFVHSEQAKLNEEEFTRVCLKTGQPICISDTPGMGKTLLLSSIAHNIMRQDPHKLTQFFVLSEFVQKLNASKINNIESIIDQIAEQASDSEFGREVVKHLLKSENKAANLIFDGFDEVLSGQVETAKVILKTVAQLKSVTIFVATRPHMRDELENTLGVLGYNIEPFGNDAQIEFLIKYWEQNCDAKNGERLHEFSKNCLALLKENMNDFERDIAGIPLQCSLLAEVYKIEAVNYSRPEKRLTNFDAGTGIRITSIFEMYKKLMEMRFGCARRQEEYYIDLHTDQALQLIFPDAAKKYVEVLNENDKCGLKDLCAFGILETDKADFKTLRFVHRTYAEYLVGMFIANLMVRDNSKDDLLINIGLKTTKSLEYPLCSSKVINCKPINSANFQYPVICYFVNAHLKHFENSTKVQRKTSWTSDETKFFDVLAACTVHDYPSIYSHTSRIERNRQFLLENLIKLINLIFLSAKHSSYELFKIVFQHVQKDGNVKPPFYSSSCPKFTALHVAVERGHFLITELLLNLTESSIIPKIPYLMHCCVSGSLGDSKVTLSQKIQILSLLVAKNNGCVNETFSDGSTPLLMSNMHLTLIDQLIQLGANINAFGRDGNGTLLHKLVENDISPQQYHDIVLVLLSRGFHQFNCVDSIQRTCLHVAIEKIELFEETIKLFHSNKAQINACDKYGDSVLFYAIRSGRNLDLIVTLTSLGISLWHRNSKNNCVLQVSANSGHYPALHFFLNSRALNAVLENYILNNKKGFTGLVQQLLSSNLSSAKDKYLANCFIQALELGNVFNRCLLNLLKEKGLKITKQFASNALKSLLCNKNIMIWEMDQTFVEVVDYFINKGGIIKTKAGLSPWKLKGIKRIKKMLVQATQCNEGLLKELVNRKMLRKNEMTCLLDKPDAIYTQLEITSKPSSFEHFCASLISCGQTTPFSLLKQCLQTDTLESVHFITPPKGVMEFIHSKHEKVLVLHSWDIELTVTRLKNTVDSDLAVIIGIDVEEGLPHVNLIVFKCQTPYPSNYLFECLENCKSKAIFVCANTGESRKDETLSDDFGWEDLSIEYQQEIRNKLCVEVNSIQYFLPEGSHLKNELLVSFIRCNIAKIIGIAEKFGGIDYISNTIFNYFMVDKLVFQGIEPKELIKFAKFGQQIGTTDDDINKLDYLIVENEEQFNQVCNATENNLHLIVYNGSENKFKLVKTRGSNTELNRFTEKKICTKFPVCDCETTVEDLVINITFDDEETFNENCLSKHCISVNIHQFSNEILRISGMHDTIELFELTRVLRRLQKNHNDTLNSLEQYIIDSMDNSSCTHSMLITQMVYRLVDWIRDHVDDGTHWKKLKQIAVDTIFPEFCMNTDSIGLARFVEAGFLTAKLDSFVFVHDSLACYLIAELVCGHETVKGTYLKQLMPKIYSDIFSTGIGSCSLKFGAGICPTDPNYTAATLSCFIFANVRLVHFIDQLCSNQDKANELKSYLEIFLETKNLHRIVCACVQSNTYNLLQIILSFGLELTTFEWQELVFLAVMFADVPIIQLIIDIVPQKIGMSAQNSTIKLKKYFSDELICSILQIAALRGNHILIQFLMGICGVVDDIMTLCHCLRDTYNLSQEKVTERMKIVDFILQTNPRWINENINSLEPVILVPNIHIDLILHILKFGLRADYTNGYYQNILHIGSEYLNAREYDQLVQHIHFSGDEQNFLREDSKERIPLQYAVEHLELHDSTLEIFSLKGDVNWDSVLFFAIKGNRSAQFLKSLVQLGADVHKRSFRDRTVLHTAVEFGNITTLKYLLSLGCDVNAADSRNYTALHEVLKFSNHPYIKNMVEMLIQHGADVNGIVDGYHTPLSIAVERFKEGKVDRAAVEILKGAGAKP